MARNERESSAGQGSDQPHIPKGVKPETYAFLEATRAAGIAQRLSEQRISERQRRLITLYFSTDAALADLTAEAGHVTRARVHQLIRSGLQTLWEYSPPDLQERYPAEHVIFLKQNTGGGGRKGVPLTSEHRAKISDAKTGREHTAETRRKISEGLRRSWQRRRQEHATERPESHDQ